MLNFKTNGVFKLQLLKNVTKWDMQPHFLVAFENIFSMPYQVFDLDIISHYECVSAYVNSFLK